MATARPACSCDFRGQLLHWPSRWAVQEVGEPSIQVRVSTLAHTCACMCTNVLVSVQQWAGRCWPPSCCRGLCVSCMRVSASRPSAFPVLTTGNDEAEGSRKTEPSGCWADRRNRCLCLASPALGRAATAEADSAGRRPSGAGTSWLTRREAEGTGARACRALAPASSSRPTWSSDQRCWLTSPSPSHPFHRGRIPSPALHLFFSFLS